MKSFCEHLRGLCVSFECLEFQLSVQLMCLEIKKSVISNSSKSHSVLKKKSSSIVYHFLREEFAKNEWRTTYLNTHLNPLDMCTKSLPGGEKITKFAGYFFII